MSFSPPDSLSRLADAMRAEGIDMWLQGMGDEFQGEYVPTCAQRLPYLSGFTGSAGLGVFRAGKGRHALFVDGRYTLQAAQQVDGATFEIINSGDLAPGEWLARQKGRLVAGFDPWLVSEQQLRHWKKMTAQTEMEWRAVSPNLVDGTWEERPAPPAGEVRLLDERFTGACCQEKYGELLRQIGERGADALVLTQPDGINWLLNIRGDDIPFNPLLLGYLILKKDGEATLYTYERTFVQEIKEYFEANGIGLARLSDVWRDAEKLFTKDSKVLLDPSLASHGWWQAASEGGWEILEAEDPTLLPKACKNAAELTAVRDAHRRDGLSLTRFLGWMDRRVNAGQLFDELEVVERLEAFRRMDEEYRGASFATIAGSGPNGAIVHYRADEKSNRRARLAELFLLDSGGQYDGGTTDVTRTVWVGNPKLQPDKETRDAYTRVLKGHIALATARFPEGTSGVQLDVLARQYLWQAGLDYDHGTGHGVGAGLCVHEGPQRISKKGSGVALRPGMILSNEPGYYAEGKYGIRIENLVVVVELGKKMLGFETLTLAPIDTRLVEISMLSSDERNWINAYHRQVFKTHEAALDERDRRWLAEATRAV